jgi:hypothetical protein
LNGSSPLDPCALGTCPFYIDPAKMQWWYPLRTSYTDNTGKTNATVVSVAQACIPYFANFTLPLDAGVGSVWYSPPCAQGVLIAGETLPNSYSASAWLNMYGNSVPMAWQGSPRSAQLNRNAITVGPSSINLIHMNITVADSQTVPIVSHTWYHIVLTYDDTNNLMAFYINGALGGGEWLLPTSPPFDTINPHPPTILGGDGYSTAWAGYILRLRMFNFALTNTDVTLLYNVDSANLTTTLS